MVNDPIGDMLATVKNAAMAGRRVVEMPYSNMKQAVAVIMQKEGYVQEVEAVGLGARKTLKMSLVYQGKSPRLVDLKRRSKPGLRIYINRHQIPRVVGGMGIAIVSTPHGVMTGREAQKRGVGGELLCEIW